MFIRDTPKDRGEWIALLCPSGEMCDAYLRKSDIVVQNVVGVDSSGMLLHLQMSDGSKWTVSGNAGPIV